MIIDENSIYERVDNIFGIMLFIILTSSFLIPAIFGYFNENFLVPSLFISLLFVISFLPLGVLELNNTLRKAANDVGELEHIIRLDEREELNNIEELFAKIELANASISSLKSSIVLNLIDRKIGGEIQRLLYDLDSRLRILFNDLKEDIVFHIETQKELLLHGNHSVSQVLQEVNDTKNQEILELQKARLDRQIAQFEELQKVLVRQS